MGIRISSLLLASCCCLAIAPCACRRAESADFGAPLATGAYAFDLPPNGTIVLVRDAAGGFSTADPAAVADVPAPFAIKAAVAAVQPLSADGAIVAINRVGLMGLHIQRDGSSLSLRLEPIAGAEGEFAGRTVGAYWIRDGKAVFFLYRHPIFETEAMRSPAHAFVASDGLIAGPWDAAPAMVAGRYLFAAYPGARGEIFLQSRSDTLEGFEAHYGIWEPASETFRDMARGQFERRVYPRPYEEASASMKACFDSLAGPLVADACLADGSRVSYVRGDLESAVKATARESAQGILVAASDGRIAYLGPRGGGVSVMILPPPSPSAAFRDAAIVGGAIVAVWEEDAFPDSGRSGLVVADAGL